MNNLKIKIVKYFNKLGLEEKKYQVMYNNNVVKTFSECDYPDNNCGYMQAYADTQNYISIHGVFGGMYEK